jgi:nucleotide-binding universal stress UspA family protein
LYVVEAVMMPAPRTHRFHVILAGVDFSRQSAKALRYAVATARTCGGGVVALHALDPLLIAAAAQGYAKRDLAAETKDELQRFVRRAVGPAAADGIECVVAGGSPRDVLMREARRRRADVVVLATTGRDGVSKMFFGSTTEGLLRRYHGAVMVVPPHCVEPDERWPHGSVLAAVGEGRHHRAMVSAAAHAAEVFGVWLTVSSAAVPVARSRRQPAPLIVLPMPDAARLQTFRQGSAAYEFIRQSPAAVLVVRTGRRIGHADTPKRAA